MTLKQAGPSPHLRRRGSVLAAVVVLLLILEIAIASLLMSSTNEQSVGVDRLDTVRAFYAAEAGTQMALREIMLNRDEDGDGAVGGVSNDGDQATDPHFGNSSVHVAATPVAGATVVKSYGACAAALRVMQATVSD